MNNYLEDIQNRDEALDYFAEKNKDRGIISPEYLYRLEQEKWYYKYREKLILDILNMHFNNAEKNPKDMECADIGVGTGKLSKELEKIFPNISRFDVSNRYCKFAEDNLGIQVEEGDLPYEISLKSYDTIFLLNVLEYLVVPGLSLGKLSNHIKEGGYLIISTLLHPFLYSQINKENGMIRRYRKQGLEKLLKLYGFEIEYFSYMDYEVFKSEIPKNILRNGWVYPLTKIENKKINTKKYRDSLFDLLKIKNGESLPMGRGGFFICKKKLGFKAKNNPDSMRVYEEYLISGDETGLLKWGFLEKLVDKYFKIQENEENVDEDKEEGEVENE